MRTLYQGLAPAAGLTLGGRLHPQLFSAAIVRDLRWHGVTTDLYGSISPGRWIELALTLSLTCGLIATALLWLAYAVVANRARSGALVPARLPLTRVLAGVCAAALANHLLVLIDSLASLAAHDPFAAAASPRALRTMGRFAPGFPAILIALGQCTVGSLSHPAPRNRR